MDDKTTKGLCLFNNGDRVTRPVSSPFDFAFHRVGTVHREVIEGKELIGVLWDGENRIYVYPKEFQFAKE